MKSFTLVALFFVGMNAQAGGSVVGNGGGFGLCQNQKYYCYDYLFTLDHPYGPEMEVKNVNESILAILNTLRKYKEPYAEDLAIFIKELFTSGGMKYRWLNRPKPPIIYSRLVDQLLPPICTKVQAIHYFSPLEKSAPARYYVDFDLLKRIDVQPGGSSQISYLLMHEWLWNYFEASSKGLELAQFNRLLHSKIFHTMNAEAYYKIRPNLKERLIY